MMTTKKTTLIAICMALVAGIVGCSKNTSETTAAADKAAPSLADATSPKGVQQATVNALPKGNPATAADQYKDLNENSLMFTYCALSSLPVDYSQILVNYSRDYVTTSDEFKKHDIETALKPKIDQEIAAAKSARYLKVSWGHFKLGQYDFQAKGFSTDLNNDTSFGWNGSYRMNFSNGNDFKLLKVDDESKSRAIEALRSKYQQFTLIAYVFAQDVDLNQHTVKAQIMKISLQDSKGNELAAP